MHPDAQPDHKKEYRKTVIFILVFILIIARFNSATLIWAYAGWSLSSTFFGFIMRYYGYLLSALSFVLLLFTRDLLLRRSNQRSGLFNRLSGKSSSEEVQIYRQVRRVAIFPFNICMAWAAFGNLITILNGPGVDSYLFVTISFAGAAYWFPRYTQFEKWYEVARQAKDVQKSKVELTTGQKLAMLGFGFFAIIVYIMPFLLYPLTSSKSVLMYTVGTVYVLYCYFYMKNLLALKPNPKLLAI